MVSNLKCKTCSRKIVKVGKYYRCRHCDTFCSECGGIVKPSMKICPACGAEFDEEKKSFNIKKILKYIMVGGIMLVFSMFLLGLIIGFFSKLNTSNQEIIKDNSLKDENTPIPNPVRGNCGDGVCSSDESCSSCLKDCGMCENAVLDKIKKSIVWVKYDVTGKNSDGTYFESGVTGSGVIVNNQNNELVIYTNRHVVNCEYNDINCFQRISESVKVRMQDGVMYEANEVSYSKSDIDLAVLTINTEEASKYSYSLYTSEFKVGDEVIAVGYPGYAENVVEFSVAKGTITNIKEVLSQSTGKSFRTIESDAYTYFGSSGGGLFDSEGGLIGITTWGTTGQSIAIDFSSISSEGFVYCNSDTYYSGGNCYQLCNKEQVMDYNNRGCLDACTAFYCNSQKPSVNDPRCKDSGYILGSDGYCHLPCSSSSSYCGPNAICLRNKCYATCDSGALYEDGTCRAYEFR